MNNSFSIALTGKSAQTDHLILLEADHIITLQTDHPISLEVDHMRKA